MHPNPAANRLLSLGSNQLVSGRHGLYLANPHDFYLGHALIQYGEYGEIEWQLLSQLVRPGMTVMEVGANIGTLTVPLARAVGPTGRVIAVEPQRVIHQMLCTNVTLNALINVETHHCGCGPQPGTMTVPFVDYYAGQRNNFGGISLAPEGSMPGERVAIRTVDELAGGRRLGLLKVDVEGMEAEVLRGALRVLREQRPFVYVENDRQEKSDALIALIREAGYRLYWHRPMLFNPGNFFGVAENIYGGIFSMNMLCVPAELQMDLQEFEEAK